MVNRVLAILVAIAVLLTTACSSGSTPTTSQTTPAAATTTTSASGKTTPGTGTTAAATPVNGSTSSRNVDLQTASMPSGALKYDATKTYKIGDAIQLPSGVVIQVTGVKTFDYDNSNEFVVAEMVIGNGGKAMTSINSVPSFYVVSGDWHWYSLDLEDIPTKDGKDIYKPFVTKLAAGEAKKASTPIQVAKDAKQLALAFDNVTSLSDPSGSDPIVFISLGIRGDFQPPTIPSDVQAVKAGTTYKIGDAFKATKRGLSIKVNSISELTQSVLNATLGADEKFIIVDITVQKSAEAKELIPSSELRLIDSANKYADGATGSVGAVARALNTRVYDGDSGRGIALYSASRDSKDFSLKFEPVDANNKVITEESATIQLGTAQATNTSNLPTPTPLATTDSSSLPAALKDVPIPSGFSVVKGSTDDYLDKDTKVRTSNATWFGKMSVKDVATFFETNLKSKGWEQNEWGADDYSVQADFYKTNAETALYLNVDRTDAGTEITISIDKQE